MTSLRQRAEAAAYEMFYEPCDHPKDKEVDLWHPTWKRGPEPRYLCAGCDEDGMKPRGAPGISDIADAIEAEARAFAERALREVAGTDNPGPAYMNVRVKPTINDGDAFREAYCQGYRHALSDVAAAIAAAARGEK
jgi:hypothetical protein